MMTSIAAVVLMLAAGPERSDAFCDNSPFVPFNRLLAEASAYEGKRVQTYVVLRTDAKEYALIRQDENSRGGALVEGDSISEAYARSHHLRDRSPRSELLADLWAKLKIARGEGAALDMAQLANYRQELLMCGRIFKSGRGYNFAADDSVLKKSYLLPKAGRADR
jgi:hypothetical protein